TKTYNRTHINIPKRNVSKKVTHPSSGVYTSLKCYIKSNEYLVSFSSKFNLILYKIRTLGGENIEKFGDMSGGDNKV
ncbi:4035_t:CDS:2, partial [Funneliformis mosseae]